MSRENVPGEADNQQETSQEAIKAAQNLIELGSRLEGRMARGHGNLRSLVEVKRQDKKNEVVITKQDINDDPNLELALKAVMTTLGSSVAKPRGEDWIINLPSWDHYQKMLRML